MVWAAAGTRYAIASTITPEEERVFGEHFAYLKTLHENEILILAGPTLGHVNTGICIFRAPDELSAKRVMSDDPAIRAKIVSGELRPFRVSLLQSNNAKT
jgi:uncharacterized protein YciI